jgi:hypothetical protein
MMKKWHHLIGQDIGVRIKPRQIFEILNGKASPRSEQSLSVQNARGTLDNNIYPWPWLIFNLMHKILIYLYIIHLLKSSSCFEHYPAHLQEVYVVIVYMQPLVSSLSAGDCLVHRVTIPEATYKQLRCRPLEVEQGIARNMQRILINVLYVNK